MTLQHNTYNLFLAIIIALTISSCNRNIDPSEKFIQEELSKKEQYKNLKTEQIKNLTDSVLNLKTTSYTDLYKEYSKIYDEYILLKFDSAHRYALKLKEIASLIGKDEYIFDAHLKYCQTFYNAGYHREVLELLKEVTPQDYFPHKALSDYYILLGRTYHIIGDSFNPEIYGSEYITQGTEALEKSVKYTTDSATLYMIKARIETHHGQYESVVKTTQYAIENYPMSNIMLSTLYSQQAKAEHILGNTDKAIKLYNISVGYDIREGTKEGLSLLTLAGILSSERNDVDKAYEYISLAIEDANTYGARQRMEAIASILPVISAKQMDLNRKSLINLTVIILATLLALVCMIVLYINTSKHKKRLTNAKNSLQDLNNRLRESNKIKNEYLGYYFVSNSQLIDKVESFGRLAGRKIKQKNYSNFDELVNSLTENHSKENLYKDFDRIFLEIFPGFVDDFNRLLPPEENVVVENEFTLTPTLRIFALIRLGISDPNTISKILNYSINTIYNYRTRMRNKSINKDDFEDNIRRIGL